MKILNKIGTILRKKNENPTDILTKNDYLLTKSLSRNLAFIKQRLLNECDDVKYKNVRINFCDNELEGTLIFIDGLINKEIINRDVINPLQNRLTNVTVSRIKKVEFLQYFIPIDNITSEIDILKLSYNLFAGNSVLLIDKFSTFLVLDTKGYEKRSIDESKIEHVIRGPKDGFVENIRTNTALIRQRLKDPKLKIREYILGERTRTTVSVIYIDDLVNKDLLNNICTRIQRIKINGIFETAYIEQFLEKNPYSMFPQMQTTERPDKVCSNLLEGKIGIFVDGSPNCLILPIGLSQLFQSPDDYYERILYGNFLRIIRYLGFLITTSFPAFYVAITTFHHDVIPTDIALSIARSRMQVPYPPVVEVILMEATIELLREASARLPASIGQTIGIVGAIVLGDAAVRAGLVSPIMVIVVAITALGAYIVPYYSTSYALRFIRVPMVITAATFGAFGIVITWCWILAHLCRLSSFGYPYLAPFAPMDSTIITDSLLRKPLYNHQTSPITKRKRRAK